MNKEYLLEYFQKNYLPKNEVLYRLPLNIPIESFWEELQQKRRSGSVILPLTSQNGTPCWYVMTEKMISASERLAQKAIENTEAGSIADMTTAMTKEMFFTSLLEGARLDFNETMDFLEQNREPENIGEQMAANNRDAWVKMMGSIYSPLTEERVTDLALTLTDGMDGCSGGYRETDGHPIAAMAGESYTVPEAAVIGSRMREFYAFMSNPAIHPLIKAAAGQAFILITRPFPEGNERLSRMISTNVLYRCGYDFFRDISISEKIAKESFRYYKAMRDITVSSGDLTYFIEYYIDLLARALDKEETEDTDDTLTIERQMAMEPLSPPSGKASAKEGKVMDSGVFWEKVRKYENGRYDMMRDAMKVVRKIVSEGNRSFSGPELADLCGVDEEKRRYLMKNLRNNGLIVKTPDSPVNRPKYRFNVYEKDNPEPFPPRLTGRLSDMIRKLYSMFRHDEFTMYEYADMDNRKLGTLNYTFQRLEAMKILMCTGFSVKNRKKYRFNVTPEIMDLIAG